MKSLKFHGFVREEVSFTNSSNSFNCIVFNDKTLEVSKENKNFVLSILKKQLDDLVFKKVENYLFAFDKTISFGVNIKNKKNRI